MSRKNKPFTSKQQQHFQEQRATTPTEISPVRVTLLGVVLLMLGTLGFYSIPGMIAENAQGTKLVNAFYCASITLMTIGYGDICPGNLTIIGKIFLITFILCGLGVFCGPVMDVMSSWKSQVPYGGIISLGSVVLLLGVTIFTSLENLSHSDALYASIITGTTIGYGDLTPRSDIGKIAVACYGIVGINVLAMILKPARDFFESFCHVPVALSSTTKDIRLVQ